MSSTQNLVLKHSVNDNLEPHYGTTTEAEFALYLVVMLYPETHSFNNLLGMDAENWWTRASIAQSAGIIKTIKMPN